MAKAPRTSGERFSFVPIDSAQSRFGLQTSPALRRRHSSCRRAITAIARHADEQVGGARIWGSWGPFCPPNSSSAGHAGPEFAGQNGAIRPRQAVLLGLWTLQKPRAKTIRADKQGHQQSLHEFQGSVRRWRIGLFYFGGPRATRLAREVGESWLRKGALRRRRKAHNCRLTRLANGVRRPDVQGKICLSGLGPTAVDEIARARRARFRSTGLLWRSALEPGWYYGTLRLPARFALPKKGRKDATGD